jgi:hypothetical protein
MMQKGKFSWLGIIGCAFIVFLLAALPAACRAKKAGPAPGAEPMTLDEVKAVFGVANDFASGAVDLTKGETEVIVAYRYYDVDLQNYEADFSMEVAPKVQAFFRKFKTVENLHFQVMANDAATPGLWKPFSEFTLDRKTVEKIQWTGLLAKYIEEQVLKTRKE